MHLRLTRTQLHLFLSLALALPLAALYAAPWRTLRAAPPASQSAPFAYVPATGHNIGLAIKRFYETNGGLAIFGLPLTELIEQDGMRVQYFERARFELHPELPAPYFVSLTRVGSLLASQRADAAFGPVDAHSAGNRARTNADERGYQASIHVCPRPSASSDEDCEELLAPQPTAEPDPRAFFPTTGHTLGGVFGAFWRDNGQLALFGYPISEEFYEVNAIDGRTYLVQYFERARFELHPELAGTAYEVQLGHLGLLALEASQRR